MMASICVEAERAEEISLDAGFTNKTFGRIDQSIAMAALFTAYHLGCKAILALTESGSTALWMSRQKIHVPIFGLTSQIKTPAPDGAVPQRHAAADAELRRPRQRPRRTPSSCWSTAAC